MLTGLSLLFVALLGFLPYVSTIKLPPIPSFWPEWVAVVLTSCWLASLPRMAKTGDVEGRQLPAATSSVVLAVPIVVLAFSAFGAVLLLQLVAGQPIFRGAPLLALFALGVASVVCIAAAKVRAAGQSARLLDVWCLAIVAALLTNLVAVVAARQGLYLYIYQLGYREPPVRADGLFGQPNQLAVFASVASVSGTYLWMRGRLPSAAHVLVSLAAAIVVAASASRAGALLWVAATALSALALRDQPRRPVGWGLLLVSASLFFAAQVGWKLLDAGSAGSGVSVLRSDSIGRIELLRDSWELVKRHPFTGVGYGNFMGARWTELSGSISESAANHTHNLIAQLAVELGVIGAALVLLPLCWALWHCAVVVTRRGVAPEQFLAGAVPLLLAGYSLVEFPLWYTFFLLPFALMLGLIDQSDLKLRMSPAPRAAGWAAFGGALAVFALLAVDYRRSEETFTALELQQREQKVASVTIPLQEASRISLLSAFDVYANLMYSRALQPDGIFMEYKLEIANKAMLSMTNQETIAREIALLVVANEADAARRLVDRTGRDPDLQRNTREFLERLAALHPTLATFVRTLPPLPAAPHRE